MSSSFNLMTLGAMPPSFLLPIALPILYLFLSQNRNFIYDNETKENAKSSKNASNSNKNAEKRPQKCFLRAFRFGDPYGTRTHVTAVKGRCLNHLTNGPGSGNLIRTDDTPGMNRMLYQLSYAAISLSEQQGRLYMIIVNLSSIF